MLAYTHSLDQPRLKPVVLNELVQHSEHVDLNSMLLPMLAALSQRASWLVMLEPPKSLNKSLLREAGVDLNKVWILRRDHRHGIDKLAQRALMAGTCHTLICWQNRHDDNTLVEQLKRTHIASDTQCLLIRSEH